MLYTLLLAYGVYYYRVDFARLSRRDWIIIGGLSLASLLTSQLFLIHFSFDNQLAPLSVAQNPVTTLRLFAGVPFLLAGAILSPAAALVVGLFSGLGRALGQTHSLFAIFHFGLAAVLAANWLQQNYQGRINQWLRQPIVAGALSNAGVFILVGLATFASTTASAGNLAALDLALSTANANFWPLLVEGAVAGGIVTLILTGLPHWRTQRQLIPSPRQRSLRKSLLSNFVRFAILLTILLVTVVFNLSVRVSTQLVVNQMVHDANTVAAEIPDFQRQLQNLLVQYSEQENLLEGDAGETLRQLFRTSPVYRRILLVGDDQTVMAFHPADVASISLTDQEQTAVAQTLLTSAPDIAPAESRADESIVSFVVPVRDTNDNPVAVLVGRVPEESLDSLIVGLQGTVGKGTGFIVDEKSRIIAHADSSRLLSFWNPPAENQQSIDLAEDVRGEAYQGRQEQTNARELVYYVNTNTNPSWTVVNTVPYAVVLNLALRIGGPLALVLFLAMAAFYVNLAVLGRNITKPITGLVRASRNIAAGGSLSNAVHTDRDDEIGQLSLAYAQMQRALKQRLDELSLLLNVSHEVSTSIDINHSMPAILQGALRGTGAAGARAVVLNPSGGHPLIFGEGPAAEAMATLDRQLMLRLRHKGELALATPNQIWATLEIKEATRLPVPALLAVALRSHDRFQGILWLGYRKPHNVNQTERDLLHTLGGQASVLVENARLFATAEGGRRRLAAVLASTSDAVIVTDQTERVLLINRAMERVFQLSASKVIGRPVADVISVKLLVEALTGEKDRTRNLEIPTGDGKIYYCSASTIISNDGQVLGRVAVLHDITHYKEIDEMKSDFVATVSHDLRSPLTFMRGYSTMLPMVGDLNEKQQEYVDKILNGIEQMSNLVDDLLDLGRIEAGVDLRYEDIRIEPLLSDIATEYFQHAHLQGIKLEVEVAPGVPAVKGDEALIRQAITNLITNGIKYAPNSGAMTLKAESLDGEVVISVTDRGPGIAKQEQMRLFEKFFRVQQRGTEKVKGSGLGLAIVKSIAERHGGRVWCQSRLGQGSTFSISLPVPEKARA